MAIHVSASFNVAKFCRLQADNTFPPVCGLSVKLDNVSPAALWSRRLQQGQFLRYQGAHPMTLH